ncbi:MAG: 30S ribosomal protein S27e [Candidatus Aenigmatarchaeota archaeon]
MKTVISAPNSRFLKVACKKCKNEQIVFSKASTTVKCLVCGEVLLKPSGGEASVKCKILQVLS